MKTLWFVIAMAVLLATAGALWAEYGTRPETGMMEKSEMSMMPMAKEFDRCTMTCAMLMNHYEKTYGMMRAHEGDKKCWSTCWSRYGEGAMLTTEKQKELWMKQRPERMRANQCAQACWRAHHEDAKEVMVGGWRSTPRDIACK